MHASNVRQQLICCWVGNSSLAVPGFGVLQAGVTLLLPLLPQSIGAGVARILRVLHASVRPAPNSWTPMPGVARTRCQTWVCLPCCPVVLAAACTPTRPPGTPRPTPNFSSWARRTRC